MMAFKILFSATSGVAFGNNRSDGGTEEADVELGVHEASIRECCSIFEVGQLRSSQGASAKR